MEGTIANMLAYNNEVDQCIEKSEDEIARIEDILEERKRFQARSKELDKILAAKTS